MRTNAQPVKLADGRPFPSIAAAARAMNKNPKYVSRMFNEGRLDRVGLGKGHGAAHIRAEGQVYVAIWRAAKAFNMHRDRLAHHFTKTRNSGRSVFWLDGIKFEILK